MALLAPLYRWGIGGSGAGGRLAQFTALELRFGVGCWHPSLVHSVQTASSCTHLFPFGARKSLGKEDRERTGMSEVTGWLHFWLTHGREGRGTRGASRAAGM